MNRLAPFLPAIVALISTLLSGSCARFRINELATNRLLSIQMTDNTYNAKAGQIAVRVKEGALYDLPSAPAIYGSRILLPLPARNIVLDFGEGDSSPDHVYAPENNRLTAPYEKTIKLPAGQIGLAVPDEDATLFQIFGTPDPKKKGEADDAENRLPAVLYPDSLSQPASEIYVLPSPDARPRKLDADRDGGTKFHGVQRIVPAGKGILLIVHTPDEKGRPVANVYINYRLDHVLSVPDSLFVAKDASVELEAIFPFQRKPEAMASLVIRKKNSFEPEKRILYVLKNGTEPREIFASDDREDLPVWTRDDGGFLLGRDEDGAAVLFQVYSPAGDYMNNNRLRYEGLRESWQDTFFNGEDRLFSVHLQRGIYEILEWK